MHRFLPLIAVLFYAASTLAAHAEEPRLAPLESVYNVQWGGLGVGDVTARLAPGEAADCYRYWTTTRPVGFVKALYGSPNESSSFCVSDGVVRSQRFESVLEGDEEQSYRLSFYYGKHAVTDENGRTREIPAEAVDSLSLHQAVRMWVRRHASDATPPLAEFTMVDRKNLTHYQFRVAGRETVETPAGRFETLKLERIDNPKKVGLFWVAEARDWQPVRILTKNGGKPAIQLTLAR